MSIAFFVSLLSTIVTIIFAIMVLLQWKERQQPNQLFWAIGLWFFGLGCSFQTIAEVVGWNAFLYKGWYISGAECAAAYLGMGTIFLLCSRRIAYAILVGLVLFSLVAAFQVSLVDFNPIFFNTLIGGFRTTKDNLFPLPLFVRLSTALLNIFGTFALCGGALVSANQLWRTREWNNRIAANFLIAAGTLIVATGSTMATFGLPTLLYISQLTGICLFFGGFLQARNRVANKSMVIAD